MSLSAIPKFSRKKPLRRGDVIVKDEKRIKVLRAKRVPCAMCAGTGVVNWDVRIEGPYDSKVRTSLQAIATSGYMKEEKKDETA